MKSPSWPASFTCYGEFVLFGARRNIASPAIHKTTVTPRIVKSSNGIASPFTTDMPTQKKAGGHGVLHCTEACGMNGVKKNAIKKVQNNAPTGFGFTSRHRRHITAMMTRPRRVQSPEARMIRVMGLIEPEG